MNFYTERSHSSKEKKLVLKKDSDLQLTWYFGKCETCNEIFDFWKYDSYKEAGHGKGHVIKHLTPKELLVEINNCFSNGCLDEDFLSNDQINRRENLIFIKSIVEKSLLELF